MKKSQSRKKYREFSGLVQWTRAFGLAFILFFLFIRPFLVQAYHVPTGSMESTLLVGDFLLVNKLAYGGTSAHKLPFTDFELPHFRLPGYDTPEKGDIIVLEYPFDRSQDFVKRCVAVAGDTVEMRDKVLYINHLPQVEPYVQQLDAQTRRSENRLYSASTFAWQYDYMTADRKKELKAGYRPTRDNFGPLFVPEGKYFCLGDNRDLSSDCRFWGFVDRELIKGRPMIIHFSWDQKHRLPRFARIGRIIQ